MAINLATDAKFGKLAIVMNETLFDFAAPTAAQVEAQILQIKGNIPYFEQFASAGASAEQVRVFSEIKAFEQLVAATLAFPQFVGLSALQIAKQSFINISATGTAPSDASINALLAAYNGNVALLVANIIVQETTKPAVDLAAGTFLVQVTNGTAVFGVPLINPNHAPTDIVDAADGDHAMSVGANPVAGTSVGFAKSVDADLGDAGTFSLATPSTQFAINAATGEITVKAGAAGLVVGGPPINLSVKVVDQGGASTTKTITINLPANSAPTDVVDVADGDHAMNVIEQAAAGTTVGTVKSIDANPGDTGTFSIVGGSTQFEINPTTGEIKVKAGATGLDAGVGSIPLQIKVTDAGGLSVTKTITINLDVNPALHTIALTAGTDVVNGTGGPDFIVGSTGGLNPTLNPADDIKGNGGKDTLVVTMSAIGPSLIQGINTQSVEALSLRNVSNANRAFVTTGMGAALAEVTITNSNADVAVLDLQSTGTMVTINDMQDDVTIDWDATVTGGAADKVTIKLSEAGNLTPIDITLTEDALQPGGPNAANVESVFLETSGPTNIHVGTLDIGNADLLDIGGTKDLKIDGELVANPLLSKVDASDLNANIDVVLDNPDGNNASRNIEYLGGKKDDRVGMGDLFADGDNGGKAIDGGAGANDVLVFQDFTKIALSTKVTGVNADPELDVVKNFEVAEFTNAVGGAQPLDASQLDGIRSFNLAGGVVNGSTVSIEGLDKNQTHTVTVANNGAVAVDMNFEVETSADDTDSGTADKVVVNMNDANLAVNLTGSEIETFDWNIKNGSSNAVSLGEPMTELKAFNLSGGTSSAPVTNFTFAGNNTGGSALFNGTGSAANQTVTGIAKADTGAGKDNVTGTDGNDVYHLGANDDVATGGKGNDKIDGQGGKDNIKGERGNDTLLGGAGDDELRGGTGNDVIDGGTGKDIMWGGGGPDTPTIKTVKVGGLIGFQDTFEIKVDGNGDGDVTDVGIDFTSGVVVAGLGDTASSIASALQVGLAANATPGFSATVAGDTVTIQEADGTGFALSPLAGDGAADEIFTPDTGTITVQPGPYDAGDRVGIRITDGVTTTDYIVNVAADGTTAAGVAALLVTAINGGPADMTATASGGVLSLIGVNVATNYTISLTPDAALGFNAGAFQVDEGGAGIDNAEAIPASITIDCQGQFEGTLDTFSFVINLPGGGSQSYSITQVPAQTGNQALNVLVTAQGANILADLGITSGSITVVGDTIVITGDADGSPIPGSIPFTLIADSGGSPIDTASVTLTAGETVTQNNAPTFTNASPASADDNTQSLTVTNVDAGEVKGNDTFIANSPDVDPNNLIGDAVDMIMDFDSNDKLAFDGATVAGVTAGPVNHLFDGPGVFGDVGSYANAFALANSIMTSNAVLDYVSMRVGGDTFVFADLDGGNAVDQAVQLVGVTTIANTQIIADPNPVV